MSVNVPGNYSFLGSVTMLIAAIDNITIDGNTISSTAGDINIVPLAGQDVIIDNFWEFDDNVLTGLNAADMTINAKAGQKVTIETVTFDGGIVTGTTFVGALTGAATQIGTAVTSSGTNSLLVAASTTGDQAAKTVSGLSVVGATGELNATIFGANIYLKDNVVLAVADTAGAGYAPSSRGSSGKILFTRGDAAQTIAFPAASATFQDAIWNIVSKTDQDLTISFPANTCLTIGDAAATSLAYSTAMENKIGARFTVYCDGTSWFAWGESPSLTLTIT